MKRLLLRARGKKQKYFLNKKPQANSDSSLESIDNEEDELIGKLIKDRYIILKYLNRGTFCRVFLVYDIFEKVYYALKIQNIEDNNEFHNEYKTLKYLQSINVENNNYNIGKIYSDFEIKINDNYHNCILFELLGDSIDSIIENYSFDLDEIKIITIDLLNALLTLEKSGIVHCDLKPDNILFTNLSENLKKYQRQIDELGLLEKYNLLLESNLPSEFYNVNKNKRKQIKKKVKGKILKMLIKNDFENIQNINQDFQNNQQDETVDKYNIKLIDFGNSESVSDIENETIYNRVYRPPENIINEEYNCKSDLWFVGCFLYELLTDSVLFDIKKANNKEQKDLRHLEMMINYLGDIPKSLIFKNKTYNKLFDKNGNLKNAKLEQTNLNDLLKDKIKLKLDTKEFYDLVNFMESILQYIPEKRLSYESLLNHNFLKVV